MKTVTALVLSGSESSDLVPCLPTAFHSDCFNNLHSGARSREENRNHIYSLGMVAVCQALCGMVHLNLLDSALQLRQGLRHRFYGPDTLTGEQNV